MYAVAALVSRYAPRDLRRLCLCSRSSPLLPSHFRMMCSCSPGLRFPPFCCCRSIFDAATRELNCPLFLPQQRSCSSIFFSSDFSRIPFAIGVRQDCAVVSHYMLESIRSSTSLFPVFAPGFQFLYQDGSCKVAG